MMAREGTTTKGDRVKDMIKKDEEEIETEEIGNTINPMARIDLPSEKYLGTRMEITSCITRTMRTSSSTVSCRNPLHFSSPSECLMIIIPTSSLKNFSNPKF
jgi:hypothetical protein